MNGVTLRDKNGDGKTWIFVDTDGERWSKCLGKVSDRFAKQYAQKVWEGILLRQITGRPGTSPTVANYIERHLEAQAQKCIARTMYNQEALFRKYVTPTIGHLRLNQVTPDDCRGMVGGWNKDLSYQSRLDYHSTVNAMFKKAVTDELIHKNPLPSAHELFGKRPRSLAISKDRVIAPADISALLKWAYANVSIAHATLLATLALTGMRPGEARALKWDVIDWRNHKIEIKWSFSSRYGIKPPKTWESRIVEMTPQLETRLRQLQLHMRERDLAKGRQTDWLFVGNRDGKPFDNCELDRIWRQCLAGVGLPTSRVRYDLRHSWASIALSNGESIKKIQIALGHANSRITHDTYLHCLPGDEYIDSSRLDACIDFGTAQPSTRPHQSAPIPHPTLSLAFGTND